MKEDPNDPRKPIGPPGKGDEPPTPAGDLTCASSVHSGSGQQIVSVEEQRQRLQRQIVQWGIASGTSITAVTVAFVPAQVIMAFFIILSLFMGFAWSVYERARLEALQIRRRGVADYLPESMVEQLMNTSFHDFMTDGAFWEENQYLFLYLIPGVTNEQLDAYVNRLVPRHRNVLRRQGLGHIFGEGFMRFLVGEARYYDEVVPSPPPQPVPRRLDFQPASASEEDAASQLEEDGEDHDVRSSVSDYTRFWGIQPPEGRFFSWTEEPVSPSSTARHELANVPIRESTNENSESIDDEDEEDLTMDGQVIMDAITGGWGSISNMALNMAGSSTVGFFTRTPIRAGLTVTAASLGVGLLGMWTGGVSTERLRMPSRSSLPSSPILYSSVLASGAAAGIMYIFQLGRGGGSSPANNNSGSSKQSKP
jgi:hypothetical protein